MEELKTRRPRFLDYRVFIVGPDGHVRFRHDLRGVTEDEAKERAKQLMDGHDVELWYLDKKIETFRHEK